MEESPPSDMPFYALATYYYTMSQVGIKCGLHFDDEIDMMQAIQGYCNRTWQDVTSEQNDFDKQIEFLHNYCFSMNFIFMTLKHVYKFEGSQFGKIEFRQKLDRGELSWTLGRIFFRVKIFCFHNFANFTLRIHVTSHQFYRYGRANIGHDYVHNTSYDWYSDCISDGYSFLHFKVDAGAD